MTKNQWEQLIRDNEAAVLDGFREIHEMRHFDIVNGERRLSFDGYLGYFDDREVKNSAGGKIRLFDVVELTAPAFLGDLPDNGPAFEDCEVWRQPVKIVDGRTGYIDYLFEPDDLTDGNGRRIDDDNDLPWDNPSRIMGAHIDEAD